IKWRKKFQVAKNDKNFRRLVKSDVESLFDQCKDLEVDGLTPKAKQQLENIQETKNPNL
ncbi:17463_t:CDS:1, partial [Dentiscutata erythropus]